MRVKSLPGPGADVFIYGRSSSDMQNEKSSDDQIEVCRPLTIRNRWNVLGEFKDESRTGRTSRNRPNFNKMIDQAIAGRVQAVIVEDVSRLMRNSAEMQVCAQRLKESGVVIITAAGSVIDGLELAIRASMAQEQSEEHGERVKRGHRATAKRGRLVGGVAYGYRVRQASETQEAFRAGKNGDGGSDLNREIDPVEGPIAVRCYEDIASGLSTEQVCQALNRDGIAGPGGGLWRTNALTGHKALGTGILRNPIYRGAPVFGRTESNFMPSKGTTKVTPGDPANRVEQYHEDLRLVSDELWYAVQERLAEKSVEKGRPDQARRATYILSGKVFCGHCGHPFPIVGVNHGCSGRRMGVACENRRRVTRQDLETAVFTGMAERLLRPHILEIYLKEYRAELARAVDTYGSRHDELRGRLRELQKSEANLFKQVEAGASGYARTRFNARLNDVGAQIEQVQRQLAVPRPSMDDMVTTEAVVAGMTALIAELGDAAAGDDRAAAAAMQIIRPMIDKVTVTSKPATGKEDGRGHGPVSVKVEGSITKVIEYVAGGREIQPRGTNVTGLELPTVRFMYYVDFAPGSAHLEHLPDAAVLFLHLLRLSYGPVEKNTLIRALRAGEEAGDMKQMGRAHVDAEKAIHMLKARGEIRAVDLAYWRSGWVLNDRGLSDDAWRERFRNPEGEGQPPLWRYATPPEAFVTVIG